MQIEIFVGKVGMQPPPKKKQIWIKKELQLSTL